MESDELGNPTSFLGDHGGASMQGSHAVHHRRTSGNLYRDLVLVELWIFVSVERTMFLQESARFGKCLTDNLGWS